MDVQAAVTDAMRAHDLFGAATPLVVGVSGGADSVCLLHVLIHLPPGLAPTVHVAHLHHGLRGDEADADAAYVTGLTQQWQLPLTIHHADLTARQGYSLEEAARRARYTFLGDVARTAGATTVAVAHNADDQVETILMHFLRGSGLSGLRGMRPRSPLPRFPWGRAVVDDDVQPAAAASGRQPLTLVRPLLEVTRAEIEAYCQRHDLHPRIDRSNYDSTFFRNRLRHELLPLLETYNPGVRAALRRTASVLAGDHLLLRQVLAATWPDVVSHIDAAAVTFELEPWRALHVALQRSVLREAIHHLRPGLRDVGFDHVETARRLLMDPACTTGQRVTLPRGLLLTVGYTTATVADLDATPDDAAGPQLTVSPLALHVPGLTSLPGTAWSVRTEIHSVSELPTGWQDNPDRWRAYLDADVVGPQPHLRVRQPQDWFQPLGLGGHRSRVHAFVINHKLPAALRTRWPLLEGQQGLAWLVGLRIDARARVQPDTVRVLVVQMMRDEDETDATLDFVGT